MDISKLNKHLHSISDVTTGLLISTIGVLLFIKKREHYPSKKNKKKYKQHKKLMKKNLKNKDYVEPPLFTTQELIPIAISTYSIIDGFRKGNRRNIISSALFGVIGYNLIFFKNNK